MPHNGGSCKESEMPKGQQRSNREKKKPKKDRTTPAQPAKTPGLPMQPWKK